MDIYIYISSELQTIISWTFTVLLRLTDRLAISTMSLPPIHHDITYSKAVLAGAWTEGLLFG